MQWKGQIKKKLRNQNEKKKTEGPKKKKELSCE